MAVPYNSARRRAGRGHLAILFLPIGSPAYDFYGGDRKGQNLYGNSLVALEAATGKLLWYYQFVPHDIWDYDPPAPPVPITVKRPCRPVTCRAKRPGPPSRFPLNLPRSPYGTELTLVFPGTLGGATWSGGSFDPVSARSAG